MRRLALFLVLASIGMASVHAADAAPADFRSFAVPPMAASAQPVAPRILDRAQRRYATALRSAPARPDFAGHYTLATWGCGASCVMAAAIDRVSGAVVMLPFRVSDWPLEREEPFDYQPDSRLLVVHGRRNEGVAGVFRYELAGGRFRLVTR
jgi:hypothetical protein